MWLLPLRVGGEGTPRCALPPGRYLLPWYHTESESLRLAWLLSHLVEGVSFFVEVPWEALPLPGNHGLRQPERAVVVVRVAPDVTPEQAEPQLARLQGRYQLVQFAEPVDQIHGDEGYGWQERFLQEHLVTLIRRNVADPDHPLKDLGVAQLPVRLATRLTTDTAELLSLLEATMSHRLAFSTLGTRSTDYEHSLWHVAGRHLAWRIMRVEPRLLASCVDLLLFDQPSEGVVRLKAAEELEKVGLGRYAGGDFTPGPLPRILENKTARDMCLDTLRRHTAERGDEASQPLPPLTVAAQAPEPVPDESPQPEAFRPRSGDRLWHEVLTALRAELVRLDGPTLRKATVASRLEGALEVLDQLATLPNYVQDIQPALARKAVQTLRAVGRPSETPEAEPLRRAIERLLRFHAARGPGRLPEREKAFQGLFHDVERDSPEVFRLAMGAACAELGWDLVSTAGDRKTMSRAEQHCTEALALTPRGSAARGSLLGVLAQLHVNRGEPEAALTLHEERLRIYQDLGAVRELAMTWTRMARIYAARGDLENAQALHYRALAVFDEQGAEVDKAVALGDIARIKAARGDDEGALRMHRQRMQTLSDLGAEQGLAIAMGDVARILAARNQLDEALRLHEDRLRIFESLGHVQGKAIAQGDVAHIKAARGEFDEALMLHRERLRTFERLDDLDGMAVTRLNIGQIEARRGHPDNALIELQSAFALNRQLGHAAGIAASGEALGRLLLEQGATGAVVPLEDARAQYERLGRTEKVEALTALLEDCVPPG
ncbi:MAG: tetratricopeptide repeat protein [Myxococcales bacterium]|nr:tetratricopeptide repeat protein [Myxococcales bacterium]